MARRFKAAMVQMRVVGGDREANLRHAEELIGEAARAGAELALLPEAMDVGWTDPSSAELAMPIPEGETCRRLSAAARAHGIYVCSGLVERADEGIYNSAVVIDRGGEVILTHRKIHELVIGHPYYGQGDRLGVCRTDLGTLGLMICADGFAFGQVLSRSLCYMGADVIVSPSAWAVPADYDPVKTPYGDLWRESYMPVARDFGVWIMSTSCVGWMERGPWGGRPCIGCSMVVGPEGQEVLQGPYGQDAETILYVDVAPVERPARGCGWIDHWKQTGTGTWGRDEERRWKGRTSSSS